MKWNVKYVDILGYKSLILEGVNDLHALISRLEYYKNIKLEQIISITRIAELEME